VIVYGQKSRVVDLPAFLTAFNGRLAHERGQPPTDALTELFVDFAEVYAAVADAFQPLMDDDCPGLSAWSQAMQLLADAVCGRSHHDALSTARALDAFCRSAPDLEATADDLLEVSAKTAEGFAYFALYPEQYLIAARRFVDERRPSTLLCIGLRSIGGALAHLVAAEATRHGVSCQTITVRPRGHPFDRELRLTQRLERQIGATGSTDVAIVDEGPGLSGSSFAAAAETIAGLGAAVDRITLFASWQPPSEALRAERGRAAFARHRAYVGAFEQVYPLSDWTDLSAGRWREVVAPDREDAWPAVQPQHERRKHRSPDGRTLKRFAGLGRRGRLALDRARTLAQGGFTTAPIALEAGFLSEVWLVPDTDVPEVPDVADAGVLARMADYLAFLRSTCATGRRAPVDDLADMIECNVGEGLGPPPRSKIDRLRAAATEFDEPEIEIDGRMQPHEWRKSGGHYLKTDALDHHADDFFPGSRDIAWDVAGAIVEWQMNEQAAACFVERYRRVSGDTTIARRLEVYRTAYLAFRLGYATLAAESLGPTPDGRRFITLQERYRRSLAALGFPDR
jgi:hypothetical protein